MLSGREIEQCTRMSMSFRSMLKSSGPPRVARVCLMEVDRSGGSEGSWHCGLTRAIGLGCFRGGGS